MLLVQSDPVGFVGARSGVCFRDKRAANRDLGCETYNRGGDLGGDEGGNGGMDVSRIRGEKGSKDEKDFPGTVRRSVKEGCAGHIERVLQRGMAFGLLFPEGLESAHVVVGVTAHIADTDGETVAHADDAELGDRVLLKVFGYELSCIAEGEEVAGWAEIFLDHGGGKVEDQDQVPYYPTLEGGGVFQKSVLHQYSVLLTDTVVCEYPYLFLLPASRSPSTVELMVPSAPSTTFSHVLVTSHPPFAWPVPRVVGRAPFVT